MTRNLKQLGYHQHNHASYPRRNAGILSKAISPTVCRRKLHHQALGSGVAKCKGRWRHSQPVCAGMHGPSQLGEGGAVRTKRCFASLGAGARGTGGHTIDEILSAFCHTPLHPLSQRLTTPSRFRRTNCGAATSPERTATACSTPVSTLRRTNHVQAVSSEPSYRTEGFL
jgi:hypothetical protein